MSRFCSLFFLDQSSLFFYLPFLVSNHLLDAWVLELLFSPLLFDYLTMLGFMMLLNHCIFLDLLSVPLSSLVDTLPESQFHLVVSLLEHPFLISFLLSSLVLLFLQFLIPLSLVHDLLCFLLGLFNFLPRFLLLHLEQGDPVCEKLSILVSSLPCGLRIE